jgi:hypothetical protein
MSIEGDNTGLIGGDMPAKIRARDRGGTVNQLIKRLEANQLLSTEEEVNAFDDALARLSKMPKDEIEPRLADIMRVFDDRAESFDVMWGLLHFVETFSMEPYLKALAEAAPELSKRAPEWIENLIGRILNSAKDRPELRRLLPHLPSRGQTEIRQILERIGAENDSRRGQVDEVLA